MSNFPLFLSVVVVVKDHSAALPSLLSKMSTALHSLVSDHELVIVDNASMDSSVSVLKQLTTEGGLANLQVYALTKEVDLNTAAWVGVESALGDFVAVIDPFSDDIGYLETLLQSAVTGSDVVFARNLKKRAKSTVYHLSVKLFNLLYKWCGGVDLANDAPHYRVMSRRVVNFILQHPHPALTYRHLPATGGFARANLTYSADPVEAINRSYGVNFDLGMRLLVSTTRVPMRLVMALSMFGALANLIYSVYVIGVAMFKADVAPGWTTLSLQQSGMFFLISLVLMVLSEYILQMASLSNEGPAYNVAQEFTSARITRRERLNIDEGGQQPDSVSNQKR